MEQPRVWIAGRDGGDATEVTAPRGRFSSPVAPGPLSAELEGHVRVASGQGSLDTERATLTLPPAHGGAAALGGDASPLQRLQLDQRAQRARLETASPVHGRLSGASAGPVGSGSVALEAAGGASADADLHRLLLRGPVTARDDVGSLDLAARDHVLVASIRSRADLLAPMGGLAGALGGQTPLAPAFGGPRAQELERIEAQGAVVLRWKRPAAEDRPALDLAVEADYLLADLARGVLVALGSPASVVEKGRGQSLRAPVVVLRDRGQNRIDFAALGGARVGTRLPKVHGGVPPAWWLEGEEALGTLTNVADPGDPPELDILDAAVWPAPGARARAGSEDGRVESVEDLLTVEKSRTLDENGTEVPGPRVAIRARGAGQPVWLWTRPSGDELASGGDASDGASSCLAASELELVEEKGRADKLRLHGGVAGHLEGDVAQMLQETREGSPDPGSQSPLASGGPWDVAGEHVEAEIWPRALDKSRELAWWERSKVLRARVEERARLEGLLGNGEPVRVAGRTIDLDLVSGKLAVAPVASGRATLALGGTEVAARSIAGDLRSGQVEARGDVHARHAFPAGSGPSRTATLVAARATALLETDEARLREVRLDRARARRQGRRELAPPPELLAFAAEGTPVEGTRGARARVETSDGAVSEADRFEWDAATRQGFARSREGGPPVLLRSPRGTALAREAELRVSPDASPSSPSAVSYVLDLAGDVRLEGEDSRTGESYSVESDRARGEARARDEAGRTALVWQPFVAWSSSERPVIASARGAPRVASAPGTKRRGLPPTEARGRVLRAVPGTRTVVLEGAPGEPMWLAAGAPWIEALRRDPEALAKGSLGGAKEKDSFALRAPDATVILAEDRPRRRPPAGTGTRPPARPAAPDSRDETRRLEDALAWVRSLHAPGPVLSRWETQTYEATALDYDGSRRCATLAGPGRVRGEGGHSGTFQRAALMLGDPDVNDR